MFFNSFFFEFSPFWPPITKAKSRFFWYFFENQRFHTLYFTVFIQLKSQFGGTFGSFGVILGLWGWLWVTFGSIWHRIGQMMRICAGLVGPKIENVHGTAARSKFLKDPPTESILDPAGGGSPGRDIERGKPLFRRKMGRQIPPRRLRPQGPGGFHHWPQDFKLMSLSDSRRSKSRHGTSDKTGSDGTGRGNVSNK